MYIPQLPKLLGGMQKCWRVGKDRGVKRGLLFVFGFIFVLAWFGLNFFIFICGGHCRSKKQISRYKSGAQCEIPKNE